MSTASPEALNRKPETLSPFRAWSPQVGTMRVDLSLVAVLVTILAVCAGPSLRSREVRVLTEFWGLGL